MTGTRHGRRAVLAGLGSAAVAIRPAQVAQVAMAAEPVVVTLSSNGFGLAALFLSERLGLFGRHGVPVKLVVVDSGSLALSALLSGSAQFAASGVSDALAATVRGQPLKLVANLYHGLSGSVVIGTAAAQKLGVTAQSPLADRRKALVGLSVAIPSATSSYVPPTLGAAMAAGGKPNLVYMAQPTMAAALQAGAVGAIMAGSPFWEPAVTGGFGAMLLDGPGGDFPAEDAPVSTTSVMTTAARAASDPATAKAIRDALAELAGTVRSDPDRVRAALADAYPRLDKATIELGFKRNSDNWSHPDLSPADVAHELAIMAMNRPMPGLDAIKPQALLIGP